MHGILLERGFILSKTKECCLKSSQINLGIKDRIVQKD